MSKAKMSYENEDSDEYNSEDNEEYIYQNQYIKTNPMINQNNFFQDGLEEQGIRINLEKIEERAPEEEESCISSLILAKDMTKSKNKIEKNMIKLKKILKYKNILYYYFIKWKKNLNIPSVKKRHKKIKKKKKIITTSKNGKTKKKITSSNKEPIKNENIMENKINNEKITNLINIFDKFEKNNKQKLLKKYLDILQKYIFITKENKNKENNKINNNNNETKTVIKLNNDDKNNIERGVPVKKRKELKVKKSDNSKKKEIKKSFRVEQVNDSMIIKYDNPKENKDGNISLDTEKKFKSEMKENKETENNIKIHKVAKSEKKKVKKIKRNKIKINKKDYSRLKKIIEKINRKKIIKHYFNKWLNINKTDNSIDNKKNTPDNQLTNNSYKNDKDEFNKDLDNLKPFKNNETKYTFELNNLPNNTGNVMIPVFLKNFIPKGEYNINNNFFIGNIDIENKIEEILKNDVEIQKRKYTSDEDPEVDEHTFRIIKLSKPIKEIEDTKNGNLEVRVPEEYIEFGTEITRYPSEIIETITTTPKVTQDNIKKNKPFTSNEEDNIFNDNIRKLNSVNINPSDNNFIKNEIKNENKNAHTNNINDNKSKNLKNYISNIIIKENEVPKLVKKKTTELPHISKEFIFQKLEKDKNKYNTNNKEPKLLSEKDKDNFFFKDKKEEEKYNNLKAKNNIGSDTSDSLKNSSLKKENSKSNKSTTSKKVKKLIRKYKKAMHLLRKVIRSRKKRNRKKFNPEIKQKFYFEIWKSKTFPQGIEKYREEKNKKQNNINTKKKEEEIDKKDINSNNKDIESIIVSNIDSNINLNKREKIINIIDIVRMHRKKNKKLKLKLKEIDFDFDKMSFCFNLWYKNVFEEDDDINEEDEEIYNESTVTLGPKKNFYKGNNESTVTLGPKKDSYKENNDSSITLGLKNDSSKGNNEIPNLKHNKINIKVIQKENNLKINNILKKLILQYESQYKKLYLKTWKEISLLEQNKNILHSRPNSTKLNSVKSPNISNFKKSGKIKKIKEIFPKEKQNVDEMNYIEKGKSVEIINKDINLLDNKKNEEYKEEEKNMYNSKNFEDIKKNYFTKVSDIENDEINNKKEEKKEENQSKKDVRKDQKEEEKDDEEEDEEEENLSILGNIFEKINDKKYLHFYFMKWYNIISIKKTKSENIFSSNKLMSKINDFSPIKNSSNNNILDSKKTFNLEISFNNYGSGNNQKRIIIHNELSESRKRANTLLNLKNIGNYNINDSNINDISEDKSEQIKNNNPIKRLSSMNINPETQKLLNNRNSIGNNNIINKKMLNEAQNNLMNDLDDINQEYMNLMKTNINIMKRNKGFGLSNKIFLDKYFSLLRQNYINIASFQILYLYSLFNEGNEHLRIKHIFNKWKKFK